MNENDARSGIGRMVRMLSHRYSLIAFFAGGLILSVISCSSPRADVRPSYDNEQGNVVRTERMQQSSRDRTQVTPPEEHLDKRSWKPSTLRPHTSRLMVGDDASLPLEGTQVHVRIDGFRARVLIDHFFMNNRSRRLEGTFQVRLPNEARPFFLGFGQSGIHKDYLPDHLSSASKTDRRAGDPGSGGV